MLLSNLLVRFSTFVNQAITDSKATKWVATRQTLPCHCPMCDNAITSLNGNGSEMSAVLR